MTREEKNQLIEDITAALESSATVYITDIAGLDAENTSNLRRACHKADIKMTVGEKRPLGEGYGALYQRFW